MRLIEFRAKSKENFETSLDGIEKGDWVYGYLVYYNYKSYIVTKMQKECGGVGNGLIDATISVDPDTIGQYTDMDDKNKVKIFEGDVIEHKFTPTDKWHPNYNIEQRIKQTIEFSYCEPSDDMGMDCYGYAFNPYWGNDYEVIGNIHDNPELKDKTII